MMTRETVNPKIQKKEFKKTKSRERARRRKCD
jgi:hypothetical protein